MKVLCLGVVRPASTRDLDEAARSAHQVTLLERNACDATFGWGVCCRTTSSATWTATIRRAPPAIREHFAYWDDIAVIHHGQRTVSGGHGFAGIGRCLCDPAGPGPRAGRRDAVPDPVHDGRAISPRLRPRRGVRRHQLARAPGVQRRVPPRRRYRLCKFIWLGTHQKFDDAFTFIFERPSTAGCGFTPTSSTPTRRR